MSPIKSSLTALAVGLVAYVGATNIGSIFPSRGDSTVALIGTEVTPSLAPGAIEVPNRGTKSGTNLAPGAKSVTPSLAPIGTNLAPSATASVTPRISAIVTPIISNTPIVSPTASVLPRSSVTPNPTQSPTPTPTPTPTPSPTATPTPSATVTPTPTPTPSAGTSHVIINEVAWAGTQASQYGEWIELFNDGDGAADLTGWAIYKANNVKLIDLSGSIEPGAYFLIERTTPSSPDPVLGILADVAGSFGGSGLKNLPAGEDLILQNASALSIDTVSCAAGWFAGDAPSKSSMERVDASRPGSVPSNWATNTGLVTTGKDAAGNFILGTPLFKNSVSP